MRQPTEYTMNAPKTIMAIESSEQAIRNRLLHRSGLCGPSVIRFVDGLWSSYLLDGMSGCLRLLELSQRYSRARLEQACRRAMYYGHGNYRTVRRILQLGIEYLPQTPQTDVWGRLW